MSQIALPLDWPVAGRDADFLVSDANRLAFEHLRRVSTWPVMATVLTGPRKSGRSLLGRIFARRSDGRLFDDAERHDEEALFHAWNDAQARRRPLLLIADAPPPAWQVRLPDLASRLAATPHVRLHEPDELLMTQLIAKLLGDRGIAAPSEVVDYLVRRIERSYVAVLAIVEALDRALLSRHRRMTVAMARDVLDAAGDVDAKRSRG